MDPVTPLFRGKNTAADLDKLAPSVWVAQRHDGDVWESLVDSIYQNRVFYAFRLATFPRGMDEGDLKKVIGGIVALEVAPPDDALKGNLSQACMEILQPYVENEHVNRVLVPTGVPLHVSVIFDQLIENVRAAVSRYKKSQKLQAANPHNRLGG